MRKLLDTFQRWRRNREVAVFLTNRVNDLIPADIIGDREFHFTENNVQQALDKLGAKDDISSFDAAELITDEYILN